MAAEGVRKCGGVKCAASLAVSLNLLFPLLAERYTQSSTAGGSSNPSRTSSTLLHQVGGELGEQALNSQTGAKQCNTTPTCFRYAVNWSNRW